METEVKRVDWGQDHDENARLEADRLAEANRGAVLNPGDRPAFGTTDFTRDFGPSTTEVDIFKSADHFDEPAEKQPRPAREPASLAEEWANLVYVINAFIETRSDEMLGKLRDQLKAYDEKVREPDRLGRSTGGAQLADVRGQLEPNARR